MAITTKQVHPRELKPGDRVIVAYGIVTVESVTVADTDYTIHPLPDSHGKVYDNRRHIGNWPEVVTA